MHPGGWAKGGGEKGGRGCQEAATYCAQITKIASLSHAYGLLAGEWATHMNLACVAGMVQINRFICCLQKIFFSQLNHNPFEPRMIFVFILSGQGDPLWILLEKVDLSVWHLNCYNSLADFYILLSDFLSLISWSQRFKKILLTLLVVQKSLHFIFYFFLKVASLCLSYRILTCGKN